MMGKNKNYCKSRCQYYKQIEEEKREYGRKMDANSGTSS